MNTTEKQYLNKFLGSFERAEETYIDIMNSESDDNDAAHLFRWMVNRNINSYRVFPIHTADTMQTLQGFIGVYSSLAHALYDDGDVSFVKISYKHKVSENVKAFREERGLDPIVRHVSLHHPLVILDPNHEEDFTKLVQKFANLQWMESIMEEFQVECLPNVKDYIKEYERVENEHSKSMKEINKQLSTLKTVTLPPPQTAKTLLSFKSPNELNKK